MGVGRFIFFKYAHINSNSKIKCSHVIPRDTILVCERNVLMYCYYIFYLLLNWVDLGFPGMLDLSAFNIILRSRKCWSRIL